MHASFRREQRCIIVSSLQKGKRHGQETTLLLRQGKTVTSGGSGDAYLAFDRVVPVVFDGVGAAAGHMPRESRPSA